MVRASTRSKTAASIDAAKAKAPASKKQVVVPQEEQPLPAPEPPITPVKAAKAKKEPKPKPERKPTRTSPRKAERAHSEPHVAEDQPEQVPAPDQGELREVQEETPVAAIDDPATQDPAQEPSKTDDEAKTPVGDTDGDGKTWCICHGDDDGTPMIVCDSCNNWYVDQSA